MYEELPTGYSWECYEPSMGDWPAEILNILGLGVLLIWACFFENFSLAIIFGTLVSSIFFFVILHEGIHLGYYKLRGHDAKFCLRIKGNIRDWDVPKPNPYVVTPEQILTNEEVKVGYILPLILLTPVFIMAIWISPDRVVDLFLLFALAQNTAGSFLDVRDFYYAVSRDSEARIWMIETAEYAKTFVGYPELD